MKNRKFVYVLMSITLVFFLANGCKKSEDTTTTPTPTPIPTITPLVYGSVTDIDGNTYKTIKIGSQTWMAENLKVTKYRNGEVIPNVTDNAQWGSLSTGGWCYYNNMPENNTVYGKMYNRFAVEDSRNIAPLGWHVPSYDEWRFLLDTIGGSEVVGGKLMETGTSHWDYTNSSITNSTGFTAVPGGERSQIGGFFNLGHCGYHLCKTDGMYFEMISGDIFVSYLHMNNKCGYSVRCVKD